MIMAKEDAEIAAAMDTEGEITPAADTVMGIMVVIITITITITIIIVVVITTEEITEVITITIIETITTTNRMFGLFNSRETGSPPTTCRWGPIPTKCRFKREQ